MAETATDIRALIRADRTQPDSAAVAHIVTGVVLLAVGSVAAVLALLSMTFPAYVPLGFGLWRAIAMLGLLLGFATLVVTGGSYYVLPRLTGALLWNERLAWAGLILVAGSTALGMVVVGAGLGDGGEPFALPWWLDLPVLAGLAIPALVALQTVRRRTEPRTYVTVYHVTTGLVALPVIYLVGNIPLLGPIADLIGDSFSGAAHVGMILLIALGLVDYAIVKETAQPLAGRQLTQIAYWSLLFGAGWFGIAQLAGGPVPVWLGTVGAVLGLGLPVALVAAGANLVSTLRDGWGDPDEPNPVAMMALSGVGVAVGAAILAALAGFRSTGNLVALTSYWEGVTLGLTMGALPLLIGAVTLHALPRMSGRALFSLERARRSVRLTLIGTVGLTGFLVVAGLVTGYAWAGGSFTGAYTAVGEGWAPATGPARTFLGLGAVAGAVTAAGNLALASLITRTLTQGRVTTQEVLVTREEP